MLKMLNKVLLLRVESRGGGSGWNVILVLPSIGLTKFSVFPGKIPFHNDNCHSVTTLEANSHNNN